jgi:hypothetical protein
MTSIFSVSYACPARMAERKRLEKLKDTINEQDIFMQDEFVPFAYTVLHITQVKKWCVLRELFVHDGDGVGIDYHSDEMDGEYREV